MSTTTQFVNPPKYLPTVGKIIYDAATAPPHTTALMIMSDVCEVMHDLGIVADVPQQLFRRYDSAFYGGNYDATQDIMREAIDVINHATYDLLPNVSQSDLRFGKMLVPYPSGNQIGLGVAWTMRYGWFDPREWQWFGFKEVVGYYSKAHDHG